MTRNRVPRGMADEFYAKGEQLLRLVREGTATQEQRDWLRSWGFLGPRPPIPKFHGAADGGKTGKKRRKRSRRSKQKPLVVYPSDNMGQSVMHIRTRTSGRNRTERRGS